MELEKMNAEYELLKEDLKEVRKSVDEIAKEIKNLELDKSVYLGEAAKCRKDAENASSNDEKSNLLNEASNHERAAKKCEDELTKKQAKLELKRTKLKELQEQINAKIEEVMQDPEVKKQLEDALKIRKERAAKKVEPLVEEKEKKEKEKEELQQRKERVSKIAEAINKNPELKKYLEEILKLKKEEMDLEKELETCKDDARELQIRRRLAELNKKQLPETTQNLATELRKEKLEIKIADINAIVENGFTLGKDGGLNLDATLNAYSRNLDKEIKSIDIDIKRLNQKIEPYKDIIAKKKEEKEKNPLGPRSQEGQGGQGEQEEQEENTTFWRFWGRLKALWNGEKDGEKFGTKMRFLFNREKKEKQQALPETPQTKSSPRDNLMKNLIVKDAYDQMARNQGIETRTHAKREEGR